MEIGYMFDKEIVLLKDYLGSHNMKRLYSPNVCVLNKRYNRISGADKLRLHHYIYKLTFESGLEEGNLVKVIKAAPSHFMGWGGMWCTAKNEACHNIHVVQHISFDKNVILNCDAYCFPFFCLQYAGRNEEDLINFPYGGEG